MYKKAPLPVLLLFPILLLTQACSTDGYNVERDFRLLNRAYSADKGIVITRVGVTYTSVDQKFFDSGFNEMNWCRIDKEKRCAEIFYLNPYTKKKLYNQYNYYSVSPGVYYLDRIREKNPSFFTDFVLAASLIAPKPKPNFTTSGSGFNKKTNSTNFASFEIKSGEIVYIGDLHFTITKQKYWVKGKIELEVEDNYDMAVNPFREKSPEFKNKSVIKRLARPGTLLNNFDAGIFW